MKRFEEHHYRLITELLPDALVPLPRKRVTKVRGPTCLQRKRSGDKAYQTLLALARAAPKPDR